MGSEGKAGPPRGEMLPCDSWEKPTAGDRGGNALVEKKDNNKSKETWVGAANSKIRRCVTLE